VLVRLGAPVEDAQAALAELPGIESVEAGRDGLLVTPRAADADPRPAIARLVVARGWDLIELRPLAVNLEEIFLEVTQQGGSPAPAAVESEEIHA
jgi:hypothetical protein